VKMNRRNRGGWSGAGEGGGGRGAPRTACGHRGQSVVAFASWRPKLPRRGRKLPVGWCGVGGGRCAAVGEEGCWGDGKPFEGGELSGDRSSGCRVVGQTGARHDQPGARPRLDSLENRAFRDGRGRGDRRGGKQGMWCGAWMIRRPGNVPAPDASGRKSEKIPGPPDAVPVCPFVGQPV